MISIVIPFYNRAAYLPETIESVLAQTNEDWECVLVDDGSTDESFSVVSQYAKKDQRIQLLTRPGNMLAGGNDARNVGWQHARSEWIMFLDSDDLIAPYCIAQRLDAVRQNPAKDMLIFPTGCFYQIVGDTDKIWSLPQTKDEDIYRFYHKDAPWHTSGVVWKKKFLEKIQGWSPGCKCFQDFEIHLRALYLGADYIKVVNQVDSYYRLPGSTSKSIASSYPSIQYRKNALLTFNILDDFKKKHHLESDQFKDFLIRTLIWEELHLFGWRAPLKMIFAKSYHEVNKLVLTGWLLLLVPTKIKFIRLLLYKVSTRIQRFSQAPKMLHYKMHELKNTLSLQE